MTWNYRQQVTLAMVPKVSAILALAGSGWIMVEVWTDRTVPKFNHPYHRLLFAMSLYDALEGVWNFQSTWPIPADTVGVFDPRGNTATCSAQGFFLTISVAVPIYNAFLSLYYVLVINYGYTDERLRKRVEPAMHVTAFAWAFGTGIGSAVMGLYNNANLWCWIAPYPAGCLDSWTYGADGNCTRGDNAWIYRWAFYFAPLWFCIFFATICTLLVYRRVRHLDRRTLQYRRPYRRMSFMNSSEIRRQNKAKRALEVACRNDDLSALPNVDRSDHPEAATTAPMSESLRQLVRRWKSQRQQFASDNPRTAEVFQQAMCYMVVFYLTHVWSTSNRIYQQINNGQTKFGLILFHSFFDPLQGFLNYLVYQRPRYLRIRRLYPKRGRLYAARVALRWSYMASIEPRMPGTIVSRRDNEARRGSDDEISAMEEVPEEESSEQANDEASGAFVLEPPAPAPSQERAMTNEP